MADILKKCFGLDKAQHSVRTEIVAGITTFLAMAYILAVNPGIFSALEGQGMASSAVFTGSALSAICATLLMAFYAKKPFALAPGMGLNAFFVYTVCLTMGHSWQFALTAVLIEGLIFILLTVTKVRDMILDAIPLSMKNAIGAGIGLFIAFIGLQNGGVITGNEATLVSLGDICHGAGLLTVIGLVISGVLVVLQVPGGILIGILATAIIGMFVKDPATGVALTSFSGVVSTPPSVSPIFMKFEWTNVLSLDMLAVVFTFIFVDLFDTMGTVIGVSQKAGMIDENGKIDNSEKILLTDAIGTVFSAMFGTNTTTTYVESSAGVSAGGRTGLTAFTTAACFALALFFAPIFLGIPSSATAPCLILVGMMMIAPVTKIDWSDYHVALPAFITILIMPVAYSISDGILIGTISYVVINALTGKHKDISPTMWILAAVVIARYIFI